jgi:hypothetical protein
MATTTRTPQRRPNLTVIMGGRSTPSGKLAQHSKRKPVWRKAICKVMACGSADELFNPTRYKSDPCLLLIVAWLSEVFHSNSDDCLVAYEILRRIPSFDDFTQKVYAEVRPHFEGER